MQKLKLPTSGEYPNLWRRGLIQIRAAHRAHYHCEQCGIRFLEGSNLALDDKKRDGSPIIGGVHHIDGNKANCTMRNLVFLCQRCHFRLHLYGWIPGRPLPLAWRNTPPHWILNRNLPYELHPQMVLFS